MFYGWVIVAFAALTCFFSGPGQNFSLGLFLDEYVTEFHISYSEVSLLFGVATISAGAAVTSMGSFVDRYGQKTASLTTGILFATVCCLNTLVFNRFTLLLSLILTRFCAQDAMVLIAKTIVNQWFHVSRGKAHALMGLGFVASQALVPQFNSSIISIYGWRTCWAYWGALLTVVFVPLSQMFVVNKPAQVHAFVHHAYS